MKQMSSVDLNFLVREFKFLENERIDSFYFDKETFYVKFYVRGQGSKFLVNKVSKYIYFDSSKDESSEPSNFVLFLRKYLKNSFLREISQVGSERILKLVIEKKDGDVLKNYYLYLELFANGNVVLCDSSNIIKNALMKKKYKDRDLLVNREYLLPPKREFSLVDLDVDSFLKSLEGSENLAKSLAMGLGIGGKYGTELSLSSELRESLLSLFDKEIEACLLVDGSKFVDFYPFKFDSVSGEFKNFDSFNSALKEYYSQFNSEVDLKEVEYEKELSKLKNRLDKVMEQKEDILREYEVFNSYGNKIYENYAQIDALLKETSKGFDSSKLDSLKSKFSSLGLKVVDIDSKKNSLVLEF